MRSSWTFYGGRKSVAIAFFAALALTAAAEVADGKSKRGRGKKARTLGIEELTNFSLSPEYSQWLVGAVSYIASNQEREEYLRLRTDREATGFIERFWRSRDDPSLPWPQEQMEGTFERRAREADKLYSEGTHLGRRTDRGVIRILYGPPAKIGYYQQPTPGRENVEFWLYSRNALPGLDERKPKQKYFFLRRDGKTSRFTPDAARAPGVYRG